MIDLGAAHRLVRDAAGSKTRLAGHGRRIIALVGDTYERVLEPESANDFRSGWEQRDNSRWSMGHGLLR